MELRLLRIDSARDGLVTFLIASALLAVVSWAIYDNIHFAQHRVFTAPLDDTYIHLRVAENILAGSYGLNSGEFSSPSSSPLWPFLLMPGVALGIGLPWAMALNLLAVAGAITIIIGRLSGATGIFGIAGRTALAATLALVLNGWGLTFIAMEHGLHLLLTVAVLDGLPRIVQRRELPSAWWVLALVLLPLTRYEGLGVAALAILVVARSTTLDIAVSLALLVALPLAAFSTFLFLNGGTWLPSSILFKLATLDTSETTFHYFQQLSQMASVRGLLAALALALCIAWVGKGATRIVALAGAAAIAGHIGLGPFGWFGRYESYLFGIPFLAAAVGIREVRTSRTAQWLLGLATAILLINGLWFTLAIQGAANSIYQLHHRMNLLATRYLPGNVTTMDIGLVSYGNPHYVADAYGLANDETRVAYHAGKPSLVSDLAERYDTPLVIVDEEPFPFADFSSLTRVALMRMQGKNYVYPTREFTVFVREPADRDRVRQALIRLGHEHDLWLYLFRDDGRTLEGFVSDCNFQRHVKRAPCNLRPDQVGRSAFHQDRL